MIYIYIYIIVINNNMIKNFIEYIKEELKDKTYMSAYHKLKRLGGVHTQRANNIRNWVVKSKSLGEVNVYLKIVETQQINSINKRITIHKELYPMDHQIDSNEKIIKEGPLNCYLSYVGLTDSFEDEYDLNSETISEELIYLMFNVFVYNEEVSESANIFNFEVKLNWISNEQFEVEYLKMTDTWDDFETKILFSDRRSALVFKNILKSNILLKDEKLKDLFMKFSTREEFERMNKLFKEFPINQLYK